MDIQIRRCKLLRDSLFVREGLSSGCPFCKALNYRELPKLGDKIRILTQYMAGRIVEVIEDHTSTPIRISPDQMDEFPTHIVPLQPGEIRAHENGSEYRTFLDIEDHLLEPEPFLPVPNWAPPISFSQAAEFHFYVMNVCNESFSNGKWKFNRFALIIPITYILNRRLPIDPVEFWAILEAHAFPLKWKNYLVTLYKDCKEVVRIYHFMDSGRNYTPKKKVIPFSIE